MAFKKRRFTMKNAEDRIKVLNAERGDTLELQAGYDMYRVVRLELPSRAVTEDLSGYQDTPRLAFQVAGLSIQ